MGLLIMFGVLLPPLMLLAMPGWRSLLVLAAVCAAALAAVGVATAGALAVEVIWIGFGALAVALSLKCFLLWQRH